MKLFRNIFLSAALLVFTASIMMAGNPDRQGEAGAAELLLNPWARSAGLHSMNTSTVSGLESMRMNIAGLSRMSGKELILANTRLYEGSDVQMNALAFGNKMGTNGAFGLTLTSMSFGDIPITTNARPEGTGGQFSPSFFNIGLGYSYMYDNKISVGVLVRGVSESLSDVSAFGFAIDAGVQYVTGEDDNFRLGISLRNIGSPMKFEGQGLAYSAPDASGEYTITVTQRSQQYELPSVLNIGASYDFFFRMNNITAIGENVSDSDSDVVAPKSRELMLRVLGNFTSNAFSRDQIGGGAELIFNEMFTLRAAYKKEIGNTGFSGANLYTGISAGASVELPFNQVGSNRIGIDYAYRATNPFRGTHNFSLRLLF